MFKQDNLKCSLILTPATIEEQIRFQNNMYALYALYKNENSDEIQVGIPGMIEHTSFHNMENYKESNEKAYFLNLGYAGIEISDLICERPIYMIDTTKKRTVESYSIINGVNIPLEDILNKNNKKLKKTRN